MIDKSHQMAQVYEQSRSTILVAVSTKDQPLSKAEEYIAELSALAHTWGLEVNKVFIQKLEHPHAGTFVGQGKLTEIADFVKDKSIGYAIFDDELSPSQVRNLEKELSCQILDRGLLILNIFAMRARTKRAKTQIALAHYQYVLPKLTRMWGHLSSQKGGSAGMRGPGEQELETDRRIIHRKISALRKKLIDIEQQSTTQRKGRKLLPRVALVGYTNVGKSTLMQLLAKSAAAVDDCLFATVDAMVRKVVWEGYPFLLTDTVGFIRKLPRSLISSFQSTLVEIQEADLLLHVVDGSHANFYEQINVVSETLADIGAGNIPSILVFNKIDAIKQINPAPSHKKERVDVEAATPMEVALKSLEGVSYDFIAPCPSVFISAIKYLHIDLLKETILEKIKCMQYDKKSQGY